VCIVYFVFIAQYTDCVTKDGSFSLMPSNVPDGGGGLGGNCGCNRRISKIKITKDWQTGRQAGRTGNPSHFHHNFKDSQENLSF
jgi:hypothetical protein